MDQVRESIKMLESRFNLFPAKFDWRGRVYEVDAVNECKTVTEVPSNQATYHFWVRCAGQSFHLCQLLPSGRWLLQAD